MPCLCWHYVVDCLVLIPLQFSRPLTLVKETIQTRNRKSTGKSKKKGKKSLPTHLPLTPPLSAGLPVDGGSIFSGQLSRNYIVATPNGNYEQPSPSIRYSEYNYAPVSYPPSAYSLGNNLHMYNNVDKHERDGYLCEEEMYRHSEDVKPNIAATTSAFNIIAAPPHYAVNASPHVQVGRGEDSMENNMATSGSFHASTYSAFSPFASDNNSPVGQSPTQVVQSPLL